MGYFDETGRESLYANKRIIILGMVQKLGELD
jgi:hypothetical protein